MNNLDAKIKACVLELINENNLDFNGEILNEYNLKDDLGFDSLNMVHLVVRIEDEFNVDIFSEGKISTINELIEFINKKTNV